MTKHLSKIFGLLMVLVVALILVACGEKVDEPTTHTVTFVCAQGVAFNPPTRQVVDGQTTTPPTYDRPGYTSSWYTDSQRTIPKDFATGVVTSDMNIYVRWTPIGVETFTVTFVGGEGAVNVPLPASVASGTVLTTPANPTRTGYTFIGWFTALEGGVQFNFATPITASITLHARWEAIAVGTVTVTFDPAGGVLTSPATVEVESGEMIDEPTYPTRAGYTFDGWFRDGIDTPWDFLFGQVTADMTLYARWSAAADTAISISSEQEFHDLVTGADGRTTLGYVFRLTRDLDFEDFDWVQPATADEVWFQGTFDGAGFTVSDITILGTATTRTGIFPAVGDGAVIKNLTIDSATVTLGHHAGILIGWTNQGAHIEIENITILDSSVRSSQRGAGAIIGRVRGSSVVANTINLDNIIVLNTSVESGDSGAGGLIGDVTNQTVNISNIIVDVNVTAADRRAGGVIGELRGETGGVATPFNVVLNLSNAFVRANVTSYSNAGDNSTGGIIGRLGQNAQGAPVAAPAVPQPSVSTFSNVVVIPVLTTRRIAGTASDVHWFGRIDTAATAGTGDHLIGVASTMTNVHVVAPNLFTANSALIATAGPVTNVPVLANSSLITATMITGEGWTMVDGLPALNGTTIDLGHRVTKVALETTYQYVRDGETLSQITVVGTADQVFDHWVLGADEFDMATPVVAAKTLTASWLALHTVSFVTGEGSDVDDVLVVDGRFLTLPTAPTKAGFRFVHWSAEDAGPAFAHETTAINADRQLHAVWIQLITVTFDVVYGPSVIAPAVIDINTAVVQPLVAPIRGLHRFVHWALEGTTNEFVWTTQLQEDTTLVAIWIPHAEYVVFTITFECEDDSFVAFPQLVEQPVYIIEPARPLRDGYRFLGWFYDNLIWDFTVAPERNMTLEARWEVADGLIIGAPVDGSVAITNAAELHAITVGTVTGNFHLTEDIDFAEFRGQWDLGVFSGIFDGLGFTIYNLSTNRTNGQQGLFQRLGDGAIIRNIEFAGANISADAGGAIIARDADNNAHVSITNISVINSTVTQTLIYPAAGGEHAAAGIIAFSRAHLTVDNISMVNVTVTNHNQRNAALIIGRLGEGATNVNTAIMRNIFIYDSSVSLTATAGERAGFLIGALNRPAVHAENIIINDSSVSAGAVVGGLFGRIDNNDFARGSRLTNVAVINSTITARGDDGVAALIGANQPMNHANSRVQNVNFINVTRTGNAPSAAIAAIDALASVIAGPVTPTWWSEELVAIQASPVWVWSPTHSSFTLLRPFISPDLAPVVRHLVSFETGEGSNVDPVEVIHGAQLVLPAEPTREYYDFVGWYLDDAFTIPFVIAVDLIVEPITLFANWEQAPTHFVITFELYTGNEFEEYVDIGDLIIEPADPIRFAHEFIAWYFEGSPWNFETAPTADMTLVAQWHLPGPFNITTEEQFILATGNTNPLAVFYIMNDLNFLGLTFPAGRNFAGTIHGQGFTLKNITAAGGIFYRPRTMLVQDLTIVNATISASTLDSTAGLFGGRTHAGETYTIRNIVVIDSTVSANSGNNGTGGFFGRFEGTAVIDNVSFYDFDVQNTGNSSGGIFGRTDTATIHVTNILFTYSRIGNAGAARVGGIIGQLNGTLSNSHIHYVVFDRVHLRGNNTGIVAGQIEGSAANPGNLSVLDVRQILFIGGELTTASGNTGSFLTVRGDRIATWTTHLPSIYLINSTHNGAVHNNCRLRTHNLTNPGHVVINVAPADRVVLDHAWWTARTVFAAPPVTSSFTANDAWVFNVARGIYILTLVAPVELPGVVLDTIDAIDELLPVLSVADVAGIVAIRDARDQYLLLDGVQRALVSNIDLLVALEHDLFVLQLEDAIRLTSDMMMYTPAERLAIHGTSGPGNPAQWVEHDAIALAAFNARVNAPVHSSDFYVLVPGIFEFTADTLEIGGTNFHYTDVFRIAFGQTIVADMPVWQVHDGMVYILYIAFQSIDLDGVLAIGDLEFAVIVDPQISGITGARVGYQGGVHRLEVDPANNQILFVRTHGNQHIHIDYGFADGAHIVRTEDRVVFIDTRPTLNLATRVLYASGIMRDDRLYMNFWGAGGGYFAPGTVIVSETQMTIYAMGYGIVQYTIINVELGHGTTQLDADAWTLANWRSKLLDLQTQIAYNLNLVNATNRDGDTVGAGTYRNFPAPTVVTDLQAGGATTEIIRLQANLSGRFHGTDRPDLPNAVTTSIIHRPTAIGTSAAALRLAPSLTTGTVSDVVRVDLSFYIWGGATGGGDMQNIGMLDTITIQLIDDEQVVHEVDFTAQFKQIAQADVIVTLTIEIPAMQDVSIRVQQTAASNLPNSNNQFRIVWTNLSLFKAR